MNIIEPFIAKMKNVSKYKKSSSLCPDLIPVVKEFPFVCGLDVELTKKNKKFTTEAWSFAETLLNQFKLIQNDSMVSNQIFQVLAIVGSLLGDIPASPNYQQLILYIINHIGDSEDPHSYISFFSTLCMFQSFVKSFFFADYFPSIFDNLVINDNLNLAFKEITFIFERVVVFKSINLPKAKEFIQFSIEEITKRKYTQKSIVFSATFIASYVEKCSQLNNSIFKKFQSLDLKKNDEVKIQL